MTGINLAYKAPKKYAIIDVNTGLIARHGRCAFVYGDRPYELRDAERRAKTMNQVRRREQYAVRECTDQQIQDGRLFIPGEKK